MFFLKFLNASMLVGALLTTTELTYFTIGKISKEQVISYAQRKNMSVEECEKWLGPVLAYS